MPILESAIVGFLGGIMAPGLLASRAPQATVKSEAVQDKDDEFASTLSSITIGSGARKYLNLSAVRSGKPGECFENPLLTEVESGGTRLTGMVLAVEISNESTAEYHQAFLHAPRGRPRQLCLPQAVKIRGKRFWLGRIDPFSLSRHSLAQGSTHWRQTSHGMMWNDNWGRRTSATFEELKHRVGAARPPGLMAVLFGRAEQFVGLRVTSSPVGATLVVNGKRTRLRTNGDVWLSGSSISRAQLQFKNGMLALDGCAVKPLTGPLLAELDCRSSK